MKRTIITLIIAVSVSAGFGCGWIVAQAQSMHKLSPGEVWANDWTSDIAFLTRNARDPELIVPSRVVLLIGSDLNAKSIVLGREYDHLSPSVKKSLMSYIPAARSIEAAQTGPDSEHSRQDLLTFLNCMQKFKLQGGLVGSCIHERK